MKKFICLSIAIGITLGIQARTTTILSTPKLEKCVLVELQNNTAELKKDDKKKKVPVKYPYKKFLKKINAFKYDGYTKYMVKQKEDSHMAVFAKEKKSMLAVIAVSGKETAKKKMKDAKWFTYKGNKYVYRVTSKNGENIAILMQKVAHNSYIIFSTKPLSGKQNLLEIAHKMDL